jgi:hypothetical protein
MIWPAVSEAMTLVGSTGMWQSMQFFTMAWPSLLDSPQLVH